MQSQRDALQSQPDALQSQRDALQSGPPAVSAPSTAPVRAVHRPRRPVLYTFGAITGIGLITFGLSWQYPMLNGRQIGPGLLPLLAAAGLTVMGALLLIDEIRHGSLLVGDGAEQAGSEQTPAELKATHHKIIWVAVITIAACIAIPLLGMLPALTVLAFVISAFVEKMRKITSAIVAAATFVAMYVIFVLVLQVQMPFGVFSPSFWGA
jgi:hypothetical protein